MVHEASVTVNEFDSPQEPDQPLTPCCAQGCRYFSAEMDTPFSGANKGKSWSVLNFARNETIYRKGNKANFAYKVVEGAVRLSRVFGDGRRQIVNFHLPGDMFGFELLKEYSSTAEAVGETVVMRCPLACVLHSSTTDPSINRQRLALLSKSLNDAERHVTMLGHQSARQRVASFFLAFDQRQSLDASFELNLPLGRQDIADYLGLTIETTCRALSELKRRQIIDMPKRRQIVVRDPSHLKAIAEGLAA